MEEELKERKRRGVKSLAILFDPDKYESMIPLLNHALFINTVDFIFLGGSLLTHDRMSEAIDEIKKKCDKPILIFPGSSSQINKKADAFLLLSLISGRNADLLIGKHVESAAALLASRLEVISTGYMLIDGGGATTASYISNTTPIPHNKPEIAGITALAGAMLGMKLIYLDGGSGASRPVSGEMINKVNSLVDLPILVGGGINSVAKVKENFESGADVVVLGNLFEKNTSEGIEFLKEYERFQNQQLSS